MKEIKIGEYARNKEGKIIQIGWVGQSIVVDIYDNITFSVTGREIVKHSSNIKDLIQVGDIIIYTINCKIAEIDIVKEHTDARTLEKSLRVGLYSLEQIDIIQILTKEQFERESYHLEE